ncbi:MAG: hypothetical protein WBY88_04170, partial [Desulfosarcina sp.]
RYASFLLAAEYENYAAYGTRDSGIPRDSQALISGFLQIRQACDFSLVHQLEKRRWAARTGSAVAPTTIGHSSIMPGGPNRHQPL